MEPDEVARWFAEYLACFVALGRGDRDDVEAILDYYDVPMLVSMGGSSTWLLDAEQVLDVVRGQGAALRADGFERSEVLQAETIVLNPTCARHEGRFVRWRADGTEIARFTVTYLIVDRTIGRRITAVVARS